jgi:DNA-binding MarR family transcriptional regulator
MTTSTPGRSPVPDEVDKITAAWQRERPDVDVSPMQVLSRVMRVARQLDRARREAFAAHEIDTWEFDVLSALRRSGAPYSLSAGQLGTATSVTSGTMTNRIDRLADRGFVRREPDPTDRRGVQVVLTDTGRAAVDGSLVDLMERERALLNHLSPRDQRALADLLRQLPD